MDDSTVQAAIVSGETLAAALAPLAGPDGVIADQVLQGIVNIAVSYSQKKAAGVAYTLDDLNTDVVATDADIAALAADLAGSAVDSSGHKIQGGTATAVNAATIAKVTGQS